MNEPSNSNNGLDRIPPEARRSPVRPRFSDQRISRRGDVRPPGLFSDDGSGGAGDLVLADGLLREVRFQLALMLEAPPAEARHRAATLLSTIDESLVAMPPGASSSAESSLSASQPTVEETTVIRALLRRAPSLSATELRVALLIRARRTTKEIARALHRSTRSIEGHRYFIRQKLGLDRSESLATYLEGL